MKYYVFLIAMRDETGGVKPYQIAAHSLEDAVKYLEHSTGRSFAYEIIPQ